MLVKISLLVCSVYFFLYLPAEQMHIWCYNKLNYLLHKIKRKFRTSCTWHTAHFIHSCVTAVVYDWLRYLSLTCIARVLGHSLRCAVSDGASDVSVLWLSLPRSLLTCRTAEPLEYHRSFLVSVENKFIQHLTDKCCSLDRYELLFVSLQKENCRPDGRELTEFRTTTLNIGETSPQCVCEREVSVTYIGFLTLFPCLGSISTADGSALVKLGNTTIICGIKAVNTFAFPFCCFISWVWTRLMSTHLYLLLLQELTNPTVEAPGKGYIGRCSKKSSFSPILSLLIIWYHIIQTLMSSLSVPNVDLPPLCSSCFRPGPPGEQAQAASQFIADVIERCATSIYVSFFSFYFKWVTVFKPGAGLTEFLCGFLKLWSDKNRGSVHRQRKGKPKSRGATLTHNLTFNYPAMGTKTADSCCSSAGCCTVTSCVSTMMGTYWMLVLSLCWLL